jgi:hypothetical protein
MLPASARQSRIEDEKQLTKMKFKACPCVPALTVVNFFPDAARPALRAGLGQRPDSHV